MQDAFAYHKLLVDEAGRPVDYVFLEVNSDFERFTGLKREDVIGRRVTEVLPDIQKDPANWIGVYGKVALTGEQTRFENYSQALGRWYQVSAYSPQKGYFVATFEDITARKKAEEAVRFNRDVAQRRAEELERLQVKLEEKAAEVEEYASQMEQIANERLGKLKDAERLAAIGATAGMVGHDIRNPLQAITSDAFLAKAELAETPDSEQKKMALESIEEIEKNVDYINKIVQDLQDYARPLNPKIEESDVQQIIESLISKNGLPKDIKVNIKVDEDARKIKADSYYVHRILYNLVTNSVQAMPRGGKLVIQLRRQADDIVLAVSDTGVGIPKNIQDKMFTLMFTTKSKGQGFGLPVVKRMTESLGGTVTFESQEGKGTTFTVRLPPQRAKR